MADYIKGLFGAPKPVTTAASDDGMMILDLQSSFDIA